MTCVVAVAQDKKLYMGADSSGVCGDDILPRSDAKVFIRRDAKMIIGFSGSFRVGQILKYSFKIPKRDKGRSPFRYLVTDFVDAFRECLMHSGAMRKDSEEDGLSASLIIGYEGKLYCMDGDYQIGTAFDEFMSIGSGSTYAMGSLLSTPDMDPKERLKMALFAADRYCTGVCKPFKLLSL